MSVHRPSRTRESPMSLRKRASVPAAKASPKAEKTSPAGCFAVPLTVSHPAMLSAGQDGAFRETLYLMVLALGRLLTCREAFGRALDLTGSQFAVLIGTAYQQNGAGVTIRALADHVMLAPTHVTTEVGRLIRKGLLVKRPNTDDRRSVLVSLSPRGEAAILELAPFLRKINDLLFEGVSRSEMAAVSSFLERFVSNSDNALAEIRRSEAARSSLKP